MAWYVRALGFTAHMGTYSPAASAMVMGKNRRLARFVGQSASLGKK